MLTNHINFGQILVNLSVFCLQIVGQMSKSIYRIYKHGSFSRTCIKSNQGMAHIDPNRTWWAVKVTMMHRSINLLCISKANS